MGRLLKFFIYVFVLLFIGVLVYSFVGDLSAPQLDVSIPLAPQ
jgi:hypothetical protein